MLRRALIVLPILLAACAESEPPKPAPEAPKPPEYQPLKVTLKPNHEFSPEITAEDYAQHIFTLSSDEYEGRDPGTLGERLTMNYLENELRRIGFLPAVGVDGPCKAFPCEHASFFQRVPMVSTTTDPATTLTIDVGGQKQTLAMGKEMVIGTRSGENTVTIDGSELVFVGYGVNAPEAEWNDYAGVDVKGKTVVVMVNDPGFLRQDETLFKGKAMTYYGRWTYKFEEAARQGAKAALIIHDTAPASYGWDVVVNSWGGAQHDLPKSEDPEPRLAAQGWLSLDAAKNLFTAAGLDFEAERQRADQRGFTASALSAQLSGTIQSTITNNASNNVVAILPGTEKPNESVLYSMHWDHLGKNEELTDDPIFNGAIDNATGVASALEIAAAFAASPEKPKRSVVLLFTTLEESGLLGSRYFVKHPAVPLDTMAGVINMDANPFVGRVRDFSVAGWDQNGLQDLLGDVLKAQNRVPSPESNPERGYYFRSDHFNFARAGVPALHAGAGDDHVAYGRAFVEEINRKYDEVAYHKPPDEFDPEWDYAGSMEDINVYYELGRRLANSGEWPTWREASEFRLTREASDESRQ
ncbi:MAG: M20/M25/M40 family metallo-hydrolase [Ahniella sp.]|nr:M20/M25/M40 family metallo-hydrolase [Ahniella sp.]